MCVCVWKPYTIQGTGWDLEEQGEDEQKFDKMMPTVVKPSRSSAFSMHPLPLELGIIRLYIKQA